MTNLRQTMRAAAGGTVLAFALGGGSTAFAAGVEGAGTIYTGVGEIYTPYESPTVLNVAKTVFLNSNDLGGPGNKTLGYSGEAQFGRLGVSSSISGSVPGVPGLSTGVDFYLTFTDRITPQNVSLNPLTPNFLRLDIGLSGEMAGFGADTGGVGKSTNALFDITLLDPLNDENFVNLSLVEFTWFGDKFFIRNESRDRLDTTRFIPNAGDEPSFTQDLTPGPPRYFFGTQGYIDIPLGGGFINDFGETFLSAGAPFLLEFGALASNSCGNEIPECLAVTDFGHTALIGNARIVDQNGNLVAGASFTSDSGYDYITPPGSLNVAAVPEPETWALMLSGFAALGFVARRRRKAG